MHISNEFCSPNYDERPIDATIDFIILHFTETPFQDALDRLCDPVAKVSCHYLIKEDGKIFQLVHDEKRSWHAGKSFWQGKRALNDSSIGIEMDNLGIHPFTDAQMESCILLCKSLVSKYNINTKNILGHSDIAPNRKIDPGIYFNWDRFASSGLGIKSNICNVRISKNKIRNAQMKLAELGYDIDVTGIWDDKSNFVIRAFQSHFCQDLLMEKGMDFYQDPESKYLWDEKTDRMLNSLVK